MLILIPILFIASPLLLACAYAALLFAKPSLPYRATTSRHSVAYRDYRGRIVSRATVMRGANLHTLHSAACRIMRRVCLTYIALSVIGLTGIAAAIAGLVPSGGTAFLHSFDAHHLCYQAS